MIKAEQLFERGVASFNKRDYATAALLLQDCVKVAPNHADAWHMRGIVKLKQHQPLDALLHFQHARSLGGDRPEFLNNLGIAFAEIGMFNAAEAAYKESLAAQEAVDPYMGLGALYGHLNRLEDCERAFAKAIALQPDLQDAHVKRGVALLGAGRWPEGWAEYKWRWENTPYPPRGRRLYPQWDGSPVKKLLVYQEQGFGDVIMGLRFVAAALGENSAQSVVLEVSPLMRRLAEHSFSGPVVVYGDPYPRGIKASAALLDLPSILGMTVEDIPRPEFYLIGGTDRWRNVVKRHGTGSRLKVGLCWSAGRRPLQPATEQTAEAKSIRFGWLSSLLDTPGCVFFSLQVPNVELDDARVVNFMDHVEDFADTASIIEELDLVITVDTSVAHLAGAVGTECWNLVRWNGYWPWLLPEAPGGASHSLWYPRMRLYRQPALGDWEPVLLQVRDDLAKKVRAAA
jgi:Tetratricopeptide repeat